MAENPNKIEFHALDGLRGVAALAVVAMHAGQAFSVKIAPHAYLAVDFFFCLSGIVIAHAYETKLLQSKLNWGEFVSRRLIRLYPLVLAGVVLGGLAGLRPHILSDPVAPAALTTAFAMALVMIPTLTGSPIQHTLFPLNPPMWSLFFELAANFLYALSLRWLSNTILIVALIVAAIWETSVSISSSGLYVGFWPENIWSGIPRTCYPFLAGVLISRLFRAGRLPKITLHPLVSTIILVMAVSTSRSVIPNALYDVSWALLLFPLMLAMSMKCNTGVTWTRLCNIGGAVSYPIYMTHYPIIIVAFFFLKRLSPTMTAFWVILIMTMATAMALVISRYYDVPVRAYLSRRYFSGSRKCTLDIR